jgi:hypothetical protein
VFLVLELQMPMVCNRYIPIRHRLKKSIDAALVLHTENKLSSKVHIRQWRGNEVRKHQE